MVGYRVPREWATLSEAQRGVGSLAALKRGSRGGFLGGYGAFVCSVVGCWVCREGAGGSRGVAGDVEETGADGGALL